MLTTAVLAASMLVSGQAPEPLPVRGLHVMAPGSWDVDRAAAFIKDVLPKEGVNTLILEIDYSFKFQKHPKVAEKNALSREELAKLAAACKEAKVRLIPEINLLGHQSWSKNITGLLRAYPELDESIGKYKDNEGIYSRSYCPRHPKLLPIVFDLINEVAEATQADAFHVGMDEVFILGDPDCPRCKGTPAAELFAEHVKKVYDHLKAKKLEMWMWADRLIDGRTNGLGDWQASGNGTHDALKSIPKDIVLNNWNYERAEPAPVYFALQGFRVTNSCWRDSKIALEQLALIQNVRRGSNDTIKNRMLGMVQTVWTDLGTFMNGYEEKTSASPLAKESAACFRALFKALRQ